MRSEKSKVAVLKVDKGEIRGRRKEAGRKVKKKKEERWQRSHPGFFCFIFVQWEAIFIYCISMGCINK